MAIASARGNSAGEQNPAYGLLQPFFARYFDMANQHVNDLLAWRQAVAIAESGYKRLDKGARKRFDAHIRLIMRLKEELYDLACAAGSVDICTHCGGQCCMNGKYHVSMLDLLAYHSAGIAPVIPAFEAAPFCPYGANSGCRMPPRFRAMTCLVFNCELVEDRMAAPHRDRFARGERLLRDAIRTAGTFMQQNVGRAALLVSGEQNF